VVAAEQRKMEGVERDGMEGSKREKVTLMCGAYHR
jgi:hypothetical protein